MLKLRLPQMRAFEKAALAEFEDEMVRHSLRFAPALCKAIGEDQLRVALQAVMARARDHGLTNRGPIRLYIEMMLLFGSAFDTDAQYPWVAKTLRSPEGQTERAEMLWQQISDYQAATLGHEAANTSRALEETVKLLRKPPVFSSDDFVDGMRAEIHRIFPQKTAYIGEEGVMALLRKGSAEARKAHLPASRWSGLLTTLMFTFGHGCLGDPLFPWIGQTLRDEQITDPIARAGQLEEKAACWLELVLVQRRHPIAS